MGNLKRLRDGMFGSPLERATRYGTFESETGYRMPLYRAHRYLAVPRLLSRRLSTKPSDTDPKDGPAARRIRGLASGGAYLEVGVGVHPVALGLTDVFDRIVCTDVPFYYDGAAPDQSTRFGGSGIEFVWDDICDSEFDDDSFDVIASWDVLEHVTDPAAFFAECRRILKPSGVLYTSYNPFFSINGGHSPATTDAHWGHALITPNDAKQLYQRIRSDTSEALEFWSSHVNRQTLADTRSMLEENGFGIEALVLTQVERLRPLAESRRDQLQQLYPSATVADLITKQVEFVAKHP